MCPDDCIALVCEALDDWASATKAGVTDEELEQAKTTARELLAPGASVWDDGVLDEAELVDVMTKAVACLTSADEPARQRAIDGAKFKYATSYPRSLLPAPCSLLPAPCSLLSAPCQVQVRNLLPPHP